MQDHLEQQSAHPLGPSSAADDEDAAPMRALGAALASSVGVPTDVENRLNTFEQRLSDIDVEISVDREFVRAALDGQSVTLSEEVVRIECEMAGEIARVEIDISVDRQVVEAALDRVTLEIQSGTSQLKIEGPGEGHVEVAGMDQIQLAIDSKIDFAASEWHRTLLSELENRDVEISMDLELLRAAVHATAKSIHAVGSGSEQLLDGLRSELNGDMELRDVDQSMQQQLTEASVRQLASLLDDHRHQIRACEDRMSMLSAGPQSGATGLMSESEERLQRRIDDELCAFSAELVQLAAELNVTVEQGMLLLGAKLEPQIIQAIELSNAVNSKVDAVSALLGSSPPGGEMRSGAQIDAHKLDSRVDKISHDVEQLADTVLGAIEKMETEIAAVSDRVDGEDVNDLMLAVEDVRGQVDAVGRRLDRESTDTSSMMADMRAQIVGASVAPSAGPATAGTGAAMAGISARLDEELAGLSVAMVTGQGQLWAEVSALADAVDMQLTKSDDLRRLVEAGMSGLQAGGSGSTKLTQDLEQLADTVLGAIEKMETEIAAVSDRVDGEDVNDLMLAVEDVRGQVDAVGRRLDRESTDTSSMMADMRAQIVGASVAPSAGPATAGTGAAMAGISARLDEELAGLSVAMVTGQGQLWAEVSALADAVDLQSDELSSVIDSRDMDQAERVVQAQRSTEAKLDELRSELVDVREQTEHTRTNQTELAKLVVDVQTMPGTGTGASEHLSDSVLAEKIASMVGAAAAETAEVLEQLAEDVGQHGEDLEQLADAVGQSRTELLEMTEIAMQNAEDLQQLQSRAPLVATTPATEMAALHQRLDDELAGVGVSIVQFGAGLQRKFDGDILALETRLDFEVARLVDSEG